MRTAFAESAPFWYRDRATLNFIALRYSALMPIIDISGFEIGLSPLLQWFVIPPVALWLAGYRPAKKAEENT